MELTKKEFEQILDEKLDKLVTGELLTQKLDRQSQLFDQKLDRQTKELKKFSEEQTEALARIISKTVVEPMEEGFKHIEKKLDDVKPRVVRLETEMKELKTVLNLS